jgi:rhodanese-related sulfurtransferase
MTEEIKKPLIVGGVSGGASCAPSARRLSESCKTIIFKRGPYILFANCCFPYYVNKVITDEKDLLVASSELFRNWFNIEVRTQSNALCIDKEFEEGHLDKAVNIPLDKLRGHLGDLSRDREIWAHCFMGKRSYYVSRILRQHGFKVKNISGAYLTCLTRRNET